MSEEYRKSSVERRSGVTSGSYKMSFLSKHRLPDKGFEDNDMKGGMKAYSTVIGGVLYMLVSC